MKISEIDKKINEFSEKSDFDQGDILYLFLLFENKLNYFYQPNDLIPFSSLVRKSNLPENEKNWLISFRNQIAHNIIPEKDLTPILERLKREIIPLILSITSDSHRTMVKEFEEIITEKLMRLADELGYNFVRNKKIAINDKKRTMIEIDAIFKSGSKDIVFEIKASSNINMISVWIDQLKTRLSVYGSNYGVLVLETDFYEEIHKNNHNILIIGEEVIYKLRNWIDR